jgi:uncharacterized protein YmfQ (DUF2313 family)
LAQLSLCACRRRRKSNFQERQPRACNKELIRNWEKVENLPEEDKQTIKKIVSALLVKHSVELAVR